jgi:hypothetical protein
MALGSGQEIGSLAREVRDDLFASWGHGRIQLERQELNFDFSLAGNG